MAVTAPLRYAADTIERLAMFALSFEDPVTGLAVREGILPLVAGLKPPLVTSLGWFAWRLDGPPAAQKVTVDVTLTNPMYGKPEKAILLEPDMKDGDKPPIRFRLKVDIKSNDGKTPPADLHTPFVLTTSAQYLPPPGMIAVVGRVVSAADPAEALPGVRVKVDLKHDGGSGPFISEHVAVTDGKGEFAAVVQGLIAQKPDPARDAANEPIPGTIDARLRLERDIGGGTETMIWKIDPPPRLGRVNYLTAPIKGKFEPPP